jgi:phage tail-like protein
VPAEPLVTPRRQSGGGRPTDWMLDRLPERWRDDQLLCNFVTICQRISDTLLQHADQLEHDFDPAVAPDEMVTLLAEWIGLDFIDPTLPDTLRRQIVLEMAAETGWSGTRNAVERFLDVITGGVSSVTDPGGVFRKDEAPKRSPHVEIRVESTGWLTATQLLEVVRGELPASLTFSLFVGDTFVGPGEWPPDTATPVDGGG